MMKDTNCMGYHGEEKRAVPGCQCAKPSSSAAVEGVVKQVALALKRESLTYVGIEEGNALFERLARAVVAAIPVPPTDEIERLREIERRAKRALAGERGPSVTTKAVIAWVLNG